MGSLLRRLVASQPWLVELVLWQVELVGLLKTGPPYFASELASEHLLLLLLLLLNQ